MDPKDQQAQPTGGQQLPDDPKDPGYTHEDLSKQSIRDIVSEEPKEAPKEDEPPVKTPEEIETEAKAAQEARENEIRDEERQKVLAEQEEERKKAEEEKQKVEEPSEKEKDYLAWEKQFATDNKRQPSYLEALQFVEEQAVKGIEERQAKAAQEKTAQEEAARKEQEEIDKKLNTVIDDELNDLYTAGKLTKIQDPNNPSDQGVVERKALFSQWAVENQKRRAAGQPEITSATRMYEFYYKKPTAQPPGADAPVQGNRGSQTLPPTPDNPGYSNADLKRPWSFFRRG